MLLHRMGQRVFLAPEDGTGAGSADGTGNQEGNLNAGQGDGSKAPAWMSQLPDDLKGNENLAQYKTMGDAFRSLMTDNTHKTDEKPSEETKQQVEYSKFNKTIESAYDPLGDYQVEYEALFKERNIPQEEAEGLIERINGINGKVYANILEKGRDIVDKQVRELWGKEYESKRALMARGYKALGDEDGKLQEMLDKSGASLNSAVWEMLSRVGRLVGEDSQSGSAVTPNAGASKGCPIDYSQVSK